MFLFESFEVYFIFIFLLLKFIDGVGGVVGITVIWVLRGHARFMQIRVLVLILSNMCDLLL